MTKIYTKAGDKGKTDYKGVKVKKDHPTLELLGTIDELNSIMGILINQAKQKKLKLNLCRLQSDLITISSIIYKSEAVDLSRRIGFIESWIDGVELKLPKLDRFILPGGSCLASWLHLARAVCRRAERRAVVLADGIEPDVLVYLNRLSDLFFVLARRANI